MGGDHGAAQLPHPPSAPTPAPMSTFPERGNARDRDDSFRLGTDAKQVRAQA